MQCFSGVAMFFLIAVVTSCNGQSEVTLPFSPNTLRQLFRTKTATPAGRKSTLSDVRILYYGDKLSQEPTTYRFNNLHKLLLDPSFDALKPTVFYAHGFLELSEDESVMTIAHAYLENGGYNTLVVDWANLGFGSYFSASRNVEKVGRELGKTLIKLVGSGLPLERLHLIGHSLGSHLVAYAARVMKLKGLVIPRLTGLDPALPGFYPPLSILGEPLSSGDASFVDVIHTDGGRYGAISKTGDADFWVNGGSARQPGCTLNSIPFTYEDFCSHWRSWAVWAESVATSKFMARSCSDYDSFLRGSCVNEPKAFMGLDAPSDLHGNFYLRTAESKPYSLCDRGAD